MVRVITNTLQPKTSILARFNKVRESTFDAKAFWVSQKAKVIAWTIFLMLFFESDTLGLLPKQFIYVYRNMKISDFILYGLVIYSLFFVKEFEELYKSKLMIIIKAIFCYFLLQFIISVSVYDVNPFEYFFRLKNVWFSFTIFPFLLLIKRGGVNYLIKLILPFAILANILYIITALTGVALMPGLEIIKQDIPGGFKVYRVFGGTFYGEMFFFGFVYKWVTEKFRLYQLFLAVLFVTPQILAFGRGAWVSSVLLILIIILWNLFRNKDIKTIFRQTIIVSVLIAALVYAFIKFIPESDYFLEAIGARVQQGEEDVKFIEGTYATRLASSERLVELWRNSNLMLGIGMHPMWVIKPETTQEALYTWAFSDIRWASVLAAYGLVGFLLAVAFQIIFFVINFKVLKNNPNINILTFFVILMFTTMLTDSTINYSYLLISVSQFGFNTSFAFAAAAAIYKYEELKKDIPQQSTKLKSKFFRAGHLSAETGIN